jgi:hypothetical protein
VLPRPTLCGHPQVGSLFIDVGQRYDVLVCAKAGPWAAPSPSQPPPPVWIRAGIIDNDKAPSQAALAVLYFGRAPPGPNELPNTARGDPLPRITPIPYPDGRRDVHPNAVMVGGACWG